MIDYRALELRMPLVTVKYEKKSEYAYSGKKGNENLKEALLKACDEYCMYCYTRVKIDGKEFFQLEHAVEKDLSSKLRDCVPNIGLACSRCNDSFKRRGQPKKQDIDSGIMAKFEKASCPDRAHCHHPCRAYKEIRKHYISIRPIVLQPPLLDSPERELGLAYNVLEGRFQPISSNKEARSIVLAHINRFNLNDESYRTVELLRYCRDVVENKVVQRCKGRYNNKVVDVFIEHVKDCSDADITQICYIICAWNDIRPQGEALE